MKKFIWVIVRVNHEPIIPWPCFSKIGNKYVGPYTIIASFKEYDDANEHVGKLLDAWRVKHRKTTFHYEIVETELQ